MTTLSIPMCIQHLVILGIINQSIRSCHIKQSIANNMNLKGSGPVQTPNFSGDEFNSNNG